MCRVQKLRISSTYSRCSFYTKTYTGWYLTRSQYCRLSYKLWMLCIIMIKWRNDPAIHMCTTTNITISLVFPCYRIASIRLKISILQHHVNRATFLKKNTEYLYMQPNYTLREILRSNVRQFAKTMGTYIYPIQQCELLIYIKVQYSL